MNMRERLEKIIANHPSHALRVEEGGAVRLALNPPILLDALLDELRNPSEEVVIPVTHWDGRDTAILVWEGVIDAIKQGK